MAVLGKTPDSIRKEAIGLSARPLNQVHPDRPAEPLRLSDLATAGRQVKGALLMSISERELWTILHGLIFGSLFLLAFAGGLAGLWSLRPEWLTPAGVHERVYRLIAGTWIMALVAWATVFFGAYVVYPWYRATPPQGADLADYPRSYLLADPTRSGWHNFGMEWKEHVAWFAPILATAVAFVVWRYGHRLATETKIRNAITVFFITAFLAAAVAGLFGAFINKAAPVR